MTKATTPFFVFQNSWLRGIPMDAHISFPPELKAKIEHEAKARGMSLPDFVRESLENVVAKKPS